MDFLKALTVVLLIQRCDSDGMPQDGEAFALGPELPAEEIVPVLSPPSLEEVEQAVQVASEQVEGGGAEEVLKELLERVVGAALGEVAREAEEKVNEADEQRSAIPEAGAEKKAEAEAETKPGVKAMEQAAEEEVSLKETENEFDDVGGNNGQETIAAALVDAGEEVETAAEGMEAEKGEADTAAEPAEETNAVVDGENVINVPPEELGFTQEVEEEAVAALDTIGGEAALEETGDKGEVEQEVPSEELGAKMREAEETPGVEEVVIGGEPDQETVAESGPSLGMGGSVEQTGFMEGGGETKEVETAKSEVGGVASEMPPDDREEIETIQSVVRQATEVEEEEEEVVVKQAEEADREGEQTALVVEEVALEEVELGGGGAEEWAESDGGGENVLQEESDEEEPDRQEMAARGEEQTALETSQASQVEDKDPRGGAGGDDPTSAEQGPNDQATPLSPFVSGGEIGSNTVVDGEEKAEDESNRGKEITSTDDLLPSDPVVDKPTLDNLVEEVPATPLQPLGAEPGEANELVEENAESMEASEPSLEAWKIGAISAAVFLVMETTVIIVYILKCHNRTSSATAPQRACEEGFVEPDAATGADCSDETLPEDNGDSQQIAALEPSDVASALAQCKEKQQEEQGTAMLQLSLASPEESANPGPGPDSSQDLRTSIL